MNEVFQQRAASYGFRVVDNTALGDYVVGSHTYPFSITGPAKGITGLMLDMKTDQAIQLSANKQLREAVKPLGSLTNTGDPSSLRFIPNVKSPDPFQTCFQALNVILPMANAGGLLPPQTCPFCHEAGMDAEAVVGGFNVPVHRHCVEQNAYNSFNEIQKNETTGSNRFLGILGALLGALVGCLPALLLLMVAQRLSGFLFALIPIASRYGYKLLRGKMDGWVIPIVIVMTLLSVFFMEQVQFFFAVHEYYGVWPTVGESLAP